MTSRPATISATLARPIRGAGQTGLGYALVNLLDSFHHFTPEQFGALVVAAGLLVSYVHNLLEDRGIIPSVLKAEPPAADPVPVVDTTVSDEAAKAVKKATTKRQRRDSGLTALGAVLVVVIVLLALSLGLGAHPLWFLLLLLVAVVFIA